MAEFGGGGIEDVMLHLPCRTVTTAKVNECSRETRNYGVLESIRVMKSSVLEPLPAADDEDAKRHAPIVWTG